MKTIFCFTILTIVFLANPLVAQEDFSLEPYGVGAKIPASWMPYRFRDLNGQYIHSFGLPKIWSDVEKAHISNAVAIMAYRRDNIDSVNSIVKLEEKRLEDILVSREEIEGADQERVFREVTKIKGLNYHGQSNVRFQNGIGYVFTFTATKGTFDKNLPQFQKFLKTVKFFEPKLQPDFDIAMTDFERAQANYRFGGKQLVEAQRAIEAHLAGAQDDFEGLKLLANIQQRRGNHRAALDALEKIPLIDSDQKTIRPNIFFQKAHCHYALGQYELARKHLQTVSGFFLSHPGIEERYDHLMGAIEQQLQKADQ